VGRLRVTFVGWAEKAEPPETLSYSRYVLTVDVIDKEVRPPVSFTLVSDFPLASLPF
jgi:hypothetical protein